MTGTRDFDRLARAWLDLMPDEAPDRVVDAVLQAVETTPQLRRPIGAAVRRSFHMNRFTLAAIAMAIVVVIGGGALVVSQFPATAVGGPSPSPHASLGPGPVSSAGSAALPADLIGNWFGTPRSLPSLTPGSGTVLQISASALLLSGSNQQQVKLLTASASSDAGRIQVDGGTGVDNPCATGQTGTYSYTLSASGQTLTIASDQDACTQRSGMLSGTWWLIDCRIPNSPTCLGAMDAGTYGSQYFASTLGHWGSWFPQYGSLTFAVPAGWAGYADWPSFFGLALDSDVASAPPNGDPPEAVEVFSNVVAESQATPCSGTPDATVTVGSASAYVAWLRTIRGLTVSSPSTTIIAGHAALSVDLTVQRPPEVACGGTDHVIEYLLSKGWPQGSSKSTPTQTHAIGAGSRDRVIALEAASGDLVVIVVTTDDASRFDAFAAQALPIVQSFQFK